MNKFMSFLKDEDGQGMVEYALIIALIAIVVIVALKVLGPKISGKVNDVSNNIDQA